MQLASDGAALFYESLSLLASAEDLFISLPLMLGIHMTRPSSSWVQKCFMIIPNGNNHKTLLLEPKMHFGAILSRPAPQIRTCP